MQQVVSGMVFLLGAALTVAACGDDDFSNDGSEPGGGGSGPMTIAEYADWCGDFVARFGDSLRYAQSWDEAQTDLLERIAQFNGVERSGRLPADRWIEDLHRSWLTLYDVLGFASNSLEDSGAAYDYERWIDHFDVFPKALNVFSAEHALPTLTLDLFDDRDCLSFARGRDGSGGPIGG